MQLVSSPLTAVLRLFAVLLPLVGVANRLARVRRIVARTRGTAVVPHIALRRHKALLAVANQVFAPRNPKRLAHQRLILRILVLHQRALHRLFLRRPRDENGLHGARVKPGIEHARRKRAGRRVEVLHLLWVEPRVAQLTCQLNRGVQVAAGVAAHQVGD